MSGSVLVFYVSSHGFGHAARDIEVINEIGRARPGVRLVMRSRVPASFVGRSVLVPVDLQQADTDTGVVQIDSLRIDEGATAQRAAAFHETFSARVNAEAEMLRSLDASLVVGDIPPLACAAAARAGLPSIVLGNFTWDWIYAGYPQFEILAPGVIDAIGSAYALATCALRLPLHGGFATLRSVVQDVAFIARRSHRSRDQVRRALGLSPHDTVVLASFGGHNLGLDYGAIAPGNPFRLLLTDYEYPDGRAASNLVRVTRARLAEAGLRYEDLIAASDVVVGKPGYGIVSECVANGTAFLYARRDRFAEEDVFEHELPTILRCRQIERQALMAGDWRADIEALLAQPAPASTPATDGAIVAAQAILAAL
jgi:L-arabinokinase